MSTLINLPPQPPYPESDSGPGTPMSGISTIAIKDGHEGTRPSGDGISAADRISRLGLGVGYFDQPQTPRSVSYTSTPVGEKRGSPSSTMTTGSTVTTEEALRATREAKLIDGMTYDEGVVDTTDRSPVPVVGKEKEKRRKGTGGKEEREEGGERTRL